jgi:hypothetical protein
MTIETNLNFSGGENTLKSICWILSVLSWLLFVIIGWISIKWLDEDRLLITFFRTYKQKLFVTYHPIQVTGPILYTLLIITMIIVTVAFIVYMIKSTCKKDNGFFEKMFDNITRWHWIAMLLHSGLFLIGICNDAKHAHDMYVAGIILVLFALICLGLMYYKTDFGTNDYPGALIKKGTYSALLAIDWYYFCYVICQLYLWDHPSLKNSKNLGIAFDIIMGIVMIIAVFFLKDVLMAIYYFLIYLGILIFFYSMHKDYRKFNKIKVGDVILSIIFMIVFLVLAVFLIVKHKMEVLK